MMDCKKALEETNGDIEKAVELLRKKGAAVAAKRSDKTTAEGFVHAYIHPGSQIGVLIEINCETDFVARTDAIKEFAHDVCMHIAAMKPLYISSADVDPTFLEKEKEIIKEQLAQSGKTGKVLEQIIEGKLKKVFIQKFACWNNHLLKMINLPSTNYCKNLLLKPAKISKSHILLDMKLVLNRSVSVNVRSMLMSTKKRIF